MGEFESEFQYADYLFQLSQKDPSQLMGSFKGIKSWNKNLHQKLTDLIIDGKTKSKINIKNLNAGTFVLQKLVEKERLNHFIISLYPGNDGYTIGVKIHGQNDPIETMRLPYEENQLLDYIDNEELSPVLVNLIENSPLSSANLFHDGCVITEVRDYRRSAFTNSNYYTSHWVMLKPTTQTIISDVISLTSNYDPQYEWRNDNKLTLESQLLLSLSPPLCLEPRVSVAILSNKLHRKKQMFREHQLLKLSKKYSQITANKVKKMEHMTAPKGLELHEFLKKKHKINSHKINNKIHHIYNNFPIDLTPPKFIGVDKIAKILPKPDVTADHFLIKVEEYIIEFMDESRSFTSVIILHQPNDDTYYGQLFVNKNIQQIHGSTCTFPLGSKQLTKRYIDQFIEILTENGRKSVKITRQIPGQPPQYSFTSIGNPRVSSSLRDSTEDDTHGPSQQKKPKLISIEHSTNSLPQLTAVKLEPNTVISPPTPILAQSTVKQIDPLTIHGTVFSPPPTDSSSPMLTTGVQTNAGAGTKITESAVAVILTPSAGISKSIQSIDSSDPSHQQSFNTSTPLPTGVSLASLSLAPVQQNLRLHNLVSLTSQGIAVPITLTMVSTASGQQSALMTTAGNMFVSLGDQNAQKEDDCSAVTYAATPTVLMSTGTGGSNVLSVPIGVAGSLGVHQLNAHLINQLKQSSGQIRAAAPQMSLLQVTNPTSAQFLRPLAPHTLAPAPSSTSYSQSQTPTVQTSISALTPQQHFVNVNALRKTQLQQQQTQQSVQILPQKSPRKRQMKK